MYDRDQSDIRWFLSEWLICTTLDDVERELINNLLLAVDDSKETFVALAEQYQFLMFPYLLSAANKARRQGLCRKWPDAEAA
jgi:hypothetical protein